MSNSYTPIIIPITSEKEPEKCPSCKKIEDIKTVCRNCGYEYTDDDDDEYSSIFMIIAFFIFMVWIAGTMYAWIFTNKPYPAEYGDHQTLLGAFQFQWSWVYENILSNMAFKIM